MTSASLPDKLPELRAEIMIRRGGHDINNMPTWIIHDAHNNKFYHVGWMEYECLRRWQLGTPKQLLQAVNQETTLNVTEDDLSKLLIFLSQNFITKHSFESIRDMSNAIEAKQHRGNKFLWLIKNYLFFRIPLLHPDHFLQETLPYMKWLFSSVTAKIMCGLAILGLILVFRQWDVFTSSFVDTNNWLTLLYLILAVFITKMFHELGHAYMAKMQGVKVPSMGIAFLVLWPVMYTDTSDSWRLGSNRKRLMISLAGMWMELYLSVIATWLWLFMSDGAVRNAIFFIASTSWIISLLINISPFLRFDGYYVLSDLWGVENLQQRSFDMAKCWIRKQLLGLPLSYPEPVSSTQRRLLIAFALATWCYRFLLYLGIAILVYHLFFKALGIFLFVVELIFFIIAPIAKELKVWWSMRNQLSWNPHTQISSFVLVVLLALFFIPWGSNIRLPATLGYVQQYYYAPRDTQLNQCLVSHGDTVDKDQTLMRLHSGKIVYQLAMAQHEVQRAQASLASSVYNQENRQNRLVLEQRLKQQRLLVEKFSQQLQQLTLRADFAGRVTYVKPSLRHAMWLKHNELLLVIADDTRQLIEAFIDSENAPRVKIGTAGVFIPEMLSQAKVNATVTSVDFQDVDNLYDKRKGLLNTSAYHASVYGGKIKVREDNQRLVPDHAYYRIVLTPNQQQTVKQLERGTLILQVSPRSLAWRSWRVISSLLIRETGF